MFRRTRPPKWYLDPDEQDVRRVAERVNLKNYSPDFTADLANIAAGGETLLPSEWEDKLRPIAENAISIEPDSDGEWNTHKRGYTKDRREAVNSEILHLSRYHQNVTDFMKKVDFEGVPGETPLEKSMSLVKMLSHNAEQENDDGATVPDQEDMLPIFEGWKSGQELAEDLNAALESIETLDDVEKEIMDASMDADPTLAQTSDDKDFSKLPIAEDMFNGRDIWLKVARNLDVLKRMMVRKQSRFEPDPEGEDIRQRPIEGFHEIGKLPITEWLLPQNMRTLRIATGVPMIRERGRYTDKQQLLYIIIDASGSMSNHKRVATAGGVLMNRLKAVITGDAQVYCRFFDSKLYTEHFAGTPEEARKLIKLFKDRNFHGGSTEIADCARKANERILEICKQDPTLTRPELVIVTDGDDDVHSLKLEQFVKTKVHAFIVDRNNDDLVEFAKATGGVGIQNL